MFTRKIITVYLLMLLPMVLFAQEKEKDKAETNKKASVEKVSYSVEGMSCGACSARVEGTMSKIAGIKRCEVNLKKGEAVIEYDSAKTDKKKIEKTLKSTGFVIAEIEKKKEANEKETASKQKSEGSEKPE